ncbi:DUF4880 domain-containing protein [Sandaracinobacter sp. RS1-74]|uniref:FecR family protein n=1 Tax=Sandaracinobacteroides sayramensis TaxID=2913411 RepID=UPI001EDA6E01|nr:DUF4880 domain-containing protein [Sandaracinobacteroides sayramensis]MCG2842822.1 DUF4880 domain-containing protein [Sandaracinobacteroides sayramensis]
MTNRQIRQDDIDDALLVEAADWLVCLTSGEATREDAARLEQWRTTSPAHEAAFREVAGVRSFAQVASRSRKPPAVSRRAVLAGGATAALAVAMIGATRPPFGLWPTYAELTADHRTAVGERFAFAPAAGVKVEMNSRTALSLIDGDRGIDLVTGEAFVNAADLHRPFRVVAGRLRAAASTAQFNVQTMADGVRIACVGGEVECRGGDAPVTLRANEQMTLMTDGSVRHNRIDAHKATAWRHGLLVFEGAPLSEVVEQLNLYRPGRIVLTNASTGTLPVNAVFHTDRIDDAVAQMQQLLNLRVRHLAGGVVLMS